MLTTKIAMRASLRVNQGSVQVGSMDMLLINGSTNDRTVMRAIRDANQTSQECAKQHPIRKGEASHPNKTSPCVSCVPTFHPLLPDTLTNEPVCPDFPVPHETPSNRVWRHPLQYAR